MAGGTTSCMGIDNFKSIYNIRDRLMREFKLNYTPHIHADSVIGWVYLNFIGYDYKNNSLGFNSEVLCKLKGITQRIKTIKFADSFGVDFHKTGYMPYVSSIVIVKDRNDLLRLSGDPKLMTPLFHDDKAYNPGKYTLETSRSVSNIVATWYTLQMIGKDGFRSLLGHAQELSMYLRKKIHSDQSSMVVVNEETLGSDVFIKVYPHGINAKEAFKKELEDINLLKKAEIYNTQFFNWLTLNKYYGNEAIAISKTSAAFYTNTGHPVQALRIYILNPYITKETIDLLITFLASAKSEYDLSLKKAMHGEVIEQFSSQSLKSTGVQSDYVECNLSNVTVTKVADKQIIGGSYYGK